MDDITSISGIKAYSQDVQQAEELLKVLESEDGTKTRKELEDLLIDYILAQMTAHPEEKIEEIQAEIGKVIEGYESDMENGKKVQGKLTSIENSPTTQNRKYLASLLGALKMDVKSWDMSNINNYK